MVINHKKLHEDTIRKFELFHNHNKKVDWDITGFVYKHFKDYREWVKTTPARRNKRLLKANLYITPERFLKYFKLLKQYKNAV